MKILEIGRYKKQFASDHILPFVKEQGEALRSVGQDVDYYTIKGAGLAAYLTAVADLKREILTLRPQVIHAHFGLSGITAVLAVKSIKKSERPKCVITFHNGETLSKTVNFFSSLFSLGADYVIYVAEHIRRLSYFKARHYSILPCGVPLDLLPLVSYDEARKKLGYQDNKKYILFGGAFSNKRKNVALLNEALALLNRDDIEVVEMRGLSRSECALRMCACDLFALPTHSEGSPQALKEAMACNCPIVATDVADIAFLLGNEQGHYLLRNPRKDNAYWEADQSSAKELAELITIALNTRCRTQGRQRILDLKLDNTAIAQRLMNIYKSL